MEGPFPPYQGEDPFVFASYAHDDSDAVFADLEHLHGRGIHIWYDDGIHPGQNWLEALANKIAACNVLVFFASEKSTQSSHCQRELHFAIDADKPIIVVHLDEQPLPAAIKFVLGNQQAILRYEMTGATYRERLFKALLERFPHENAAVTHKILAPAPVDSRKITTLAILPFRYAPDTEELADLAEFCTEEIGMLSAATLANFHVLSRSTVARSAAVEPDPKRLGETLGAGFVLGGSLRRTGEMNRIAVELIDTRDGATLWNSRLSVDAAGGEGYLSTALEQLRVRVVGEIFETFIAAIDGIPNDELDAIALVARAFTYPWNTREGRTARLETLRLALDKDPGNAWAHCTMASILSTLVGHGFSRSPEDDRTLANHHIQEALKTGRNHQPVLGISSEACRIMGDRARSLALARQCYGLVQSLPAKQILISALIANGRAEEALLHTEEVDRSTPEGFSRPLGALRDCHILMEAWEQALEYSTALLYSDLGANVGVGYVDQLVHACILSELDRIDEAKAAVEAARRILPGLKLDAAVDGFKNAYGRPQFYRGLEKLVELGVG